MKTKTRGLEQGHIASYDPEKRSGTIRKENGMLIPFRERDQRIVVFNGTRTPYFHDIPKEATRASLIPVPGQPVFFRLRSDMPRIDAWGINARGDLTHIPSSLPDLHARLEKLAPHQRVELVFGSHAQGNLLKRAIDALLSMQRDGHILFPRATAENLESIRGYGNPGAFRHYTMTICKGFDPKRFINAVLGLEVLETMKFFPG